MRMLESEGFSFEGYVDIFDGGPTMTARTDQVASIANSKPASLAATECDAGEQALIATGHLSSFRCCYGARAVLENGIAIDSRAADILDARRGDTVWSVAR
jgi:arginine N-succinyltransferase